MGRHFRSDTADPGPSSPSVQQSPRPEVPPPFGKLDGLDRYDFREAAYEVFFTACRSSPGFGSRGTITYYNAASEGGGGGGSGGGDGGAPVKPPGVGMAVTSRVKRALGLKMVRPTRRSNSFGSNPSSPVAGPSSPRLGSTLPAGAARLRRPMTSAEIMRQQMGVTEGSDNRLRKTLMRTLVGQMGRRAETIILPLELLRHLKPSEFNDAQEYHQWQRRQLKILEAGLLIHPCIPLESSDEFAPKLKEVIDASEAKAIDTGKNSETMRTLCSSVVSLAWRSPDGNTTDVCHWADGFPLNLHIYTALLSAIFDTKDETLVLDEVDELLELMKKTWSMLGINRSIHNLCFTWVLFDQYVLTGQVEPDLLGAALLMLTEVANDAKKADREPVYLKMLACVLGAMKQWSEIGLLDYHTYFNEETVVLMENMLPFLFSATRILEEDVPSYVASNQEKGQVDGDDSSGNRVDHYIRSSMSKAFSQMVEDHNVSSSNSTEGQDMSEAVIKLARKTEELAAKERDVFSPILRKWHPIAAGVAAVSLHTCYGSLLNQFLTNKTSLLNENILVLQRAAKLEKALVQLVVEDSVECEDGGRAMVREMVPYEIDSIIVRLVKDWIQERLQKGNEHIGRAKQTETWNPKCKTEPYANSSVEIVDFAKEVVDDFFEIPVSMSESVFYELIDGLENVFKDYIGFVTSCGAKQSYLPTLPPLTRCSQDSKFFKLWKIAACNVGVDGPHRGVASDANHPRPSTSRGTQRLYIRLNTIHYLVSQLHSLDKTLSLSPKVSQAKSRSSNRKQPASSYFESTHAALQTASQYISEVSAYRLMFLDSNSFFYGSLYVGGVANSRIRPALRILKQNLTLLCAIVTEQAQTQALKEVMKASFEAFLMVLLAGGNSRMFSRLDHPMIEEDFENLKRIFCAVGEGLMVEDIVEREAEVVDGIVELMGRQSEQLVEDFSSVAGDAIGGIGGVGPGQKLPMPPTTGKWHKTDPNTILRVLCSRNEKASNAFLKKTFHLAKRRPVALHT